MPKQKDKQEEVLENVEEVKTEEQSEQETVEISEDEKKISELEEKIKEQDEKYMLLFAEYDNYRKRTTKEKDARYADAVIDTVNEFLQVADNLERAVLVNVESEEAKNVLSGVELVKKQMADILTKLGVEEIKAVGEEFDPNLHNAVMHIEDENITENTVVEEFQKGYIYKKERVVRHSMVKVAN